MIAVAIHGAEGRMGRLLAPLVDAATDCELVGLVTEPGRNLAVGVLHPTLPVIGQDTMAQKLPSHCVVIDSSLASALDGLLVACRALETNLVIGTTGFTAAQLSNLADFSQGQAVVRAANYSLGIPALQMVLQLLARTLPAEFTAEQVETHHITKIDKPSGTAAHLNSVWADHRNGAEVPTHSQRLGGVIGEHRWTVSDAEETLEITHRAHSRQAFPRGVLPSVRFVSGAEPGQYNLTDVLQGLAAKR